MQRIHEPVGDPVFPQINQDIKKKNIISAQWLGAAIDIPLHEQFENTIRLHDKIYRFTGAYQPARAID